MNVLVDMDVPMDVMLDDKIWAEASLQAIRQASKHGALTINVVVYAELAAGYGRSDQVDT